MPSVQFFGISQVVAAAENMDCPAWAIYNGRMLFMKFEGGTMEESIAFLDGALTMLANSGTTAIYTIKFFETEEGAKIKINEKSVCTGGSFNFKLVDPEQRAVVQYGGNVGYAANKVANDNFDKIANILEKQQQQINALLENQEEEEEPETLTGVLIDTLKNPDKLMSFIGAIKSLTGQQPMQVAAIGSTNATAAPAPAPANVNATVQPGHVMSEAEAEQRLVRLGHAVDFLMEVDPQFIEHLEKLVDMEKKSPGKIKSLLAWL